MAEDATREALLQLASAFRAQLPERLRELRAEFETCADVCALGGELARLRQLVHRLAGTSGTFGLARISEAARSLERAVSRLQQEGSLDARSEWARLRIQFQGLVQAMQEPEGGTPDVSMVPTPSEGGVEPLVVLVMNDTREAAALSAMLGENRYRAVRFDSISGCRQAVAAGEVRPAVVLLDRIILAIEHEGSGELEALRKALGSLVPLIFVCIRDDLATRLSAYRLGASRYIVEPIDHPRLLVMLDELTRRIPDQPYRVMIVDDEPLVLEAHGAVLRRAGMQVLALSAPLDVFERLPEFRPDVLVLDVYMPDCTGAELAAILREQDEYAHLPILFLSSETDFHKQLLALDLGGDDFLVKPVSPAHLTSAVLARARRARRYNELITALRSSLYEREREHLAVNRHALVSMVDARGDIIYANDRFCEVSGFAREELIGRNHRVVKSGEHPPSFFEELWHTITRGEVWQGVICNRRKTGELYWVESTIVPFLDASGIPYQYVSIRTDISGIKSSEQRLRVLERAIDASVSAVAITDATRADMPVTYVNPAFEQMSGHAREAMMGLNCRMLQGDDRDQPDIQRIREALARGEQVEALLRNYRKNGEMFWNELRIAPVHDETGRLTNFIGLAHDVTERKRAEEELLRAKETAEQANRAKSEFLSSVSHELRTPMNAILGFAQMLDIDQRLDDDQRENVGEILKAGRHLLSLINDVLDLAKVEAGRVELSIEPVNCADVFNECSALIAPLARDRQVTLSPVLSPTLAVFADRVRFKQIALNLLSNAVKYNRDGGWVRISAEQRGDRVRVEVADSGRGIPASRLDDLFQPFNRLGAEHGRVEGVGIGLVISRRLVEMMAGDMGVETDEGKGSVFWFELPRAEFEPAALPLDDKPDGLDGAVADARSTVLYIEDNPANLKLVANILGRIPDLQLVTAPAPELGIELARTCRPNLILLDINMPGMSGYEVLEILRAEERFDGVPIVALTANAMPRDIERGLQAGFDAYLTKPLDVARFRNDVLGFLEKGVA